MNGKLRCMTALYLLCGDEVLLLFRQGGRVVSEVYTGAAGGHFEPEEWQDAKACILRETAEEVGLGEEALPGLHLKYLMLRRVENELRLNYYFFAEIQEKPEGLSSNEGRLEWVKQDAALDLPMPLSAKAAWAHWLREGRLTDDFYTGTVVGEEAVFTALPIT